MSTAILDRIRQAGGTVTIGDGRLRVRVPAGLLTAADKAVLLDQRDDLLRLLAADQPVGRQQAAETPQTQQAGTADAWETAIIPPPPCPQCGSLELWQDCRGGWHCMRCEAAGLRRSRDLASRARRLREQADRGRGGKSSRVQGGDRSPQTQRNVNISPVFRRGGA